MTVKPTSQGWTQFGDLACETALPVTQNISRTDGQTVISSVDTLLGNLLEDRNLRFVGGGNISFTSPTLTFGEQLDLIYNNAGTQETISSVIAAAGTLTFSSNNTLAYVVLTKGTPGSVVVTSSVSSLPAATANQEVFLIAVRRDDISGTARVYLADGTSFQTGQSGLLGASGSGSGSGQKNYLTSSTSTSAGWVGYGTVTPTTDTTAADLPRAITTKTGWKLTPSGSTSGTFTVTIATPAVFTATAHGMLTGYTVTFSTTGALPTGLTAGTVYYVNVLSANTFNVSTSQANLIAGTYVATTGTQSGTQSFTFGGAKLQFTLDAADYNVKQQLQWAQNILSGTTGDWEVDVYSNTASNYSGTYTRLPLSTDTSLLETILPQLEGTFKSSYDAPGSAQQYIELRFNKLAANTHALVGSDLIAGPGVVVQGAAVTQWQAFTPIVTGLGTGTSSNTGQYQRIGDTLHIQFRIATTSPGSGSSIVTISIPNGYTINTSEETAAEMTGWAGLDTPAAFGAVQQLAANTSTTFVARVAGSANNIVGSAFVSGSELHGYFIVPVNELAGSGTLNVSQNDVEYAWNFGNVTTTGGSDTTSFGYGPSGTPVLAIDSTHPLATTSFTVQFQTPIQPTDRIVLEATTGSSGSWTSVSDRGFGYLVQGTSNYGTTIVQSTSTQVIVNFNNGGYQASNGTYAGNGAAWSGLSTFKWRVRKERAGAAVGFGIVQPGISSGLVSASGVPGNTSGNVIPTGYVGEVVQTTTTVTASTNFSTAAATSVTLSAGVWDITGMSTCGAQTLVGTYIGLYINTTHFSSGSVTVQLAGCTFGYDQVIGALNAAAGTGQAIIPKKRVYLTTSTTYFLGTASDNTSASNFTLSLIAERVA